MDGGALDVAMTPPGTKPGGGSYGIGRTPAAATATASATTRRVLDELGH